MEEGWFSLSIAASSRDIRLTEDVYVQSDDEFRAPLTGYNTIGEFYEDNRYSPRVKEVFGQLGITEDHSLFPIITGILMKDLPAFMDFLYLPREQSVQMQQYIIGSSSV